MKWQPLLLLGVFCFALAGEVQSAQGASQYSLDRPGVLIITAGQDSTGAFQWRSGPGAGRISLTWDGGVLSVPDTLALDGFPNLDLGVPLQAGFSGNGQAGPLKLVDGIYPVSETLMMGDGVVQLMITSGELTINGPRFTYCRLQPKKSKLQANLVFIAGLLVLIGVLLRRARKKLRDKA